MAQKSTLHKKRVVIKDDTGAEHIDLIRQINPRRPISREPKIKPYYMIQKRGRMLIPRWAHSMFDAYARFAILASLEKQCWYIIPTNKPDRTLKIYRYKKKFRELELSLWVISEEPMKVIVRPAELNGVPCLSITKYEEQDVRNENGD
jgi:hypothetical protein